MEDAAMEGCRFAGVSRTLCTAVVPHEMPHVNSIAMWSINVLL